MNNPSFYENNLNQSMFRKFIVLFLDDTHLLAVPEALLILTQDEFGDIIIPCRPTSPDVNVTLMKNEEEVC